MKIRDYVMDFDIESEVAYSTAHYCLLDTLGCGILALSYSACTRHLGPVVPGTYVPNAVRVPGTMHKLDPIKGAWDIGTMVRWLDYNDTWLAAEWGHPSDNLGGILSVCDYLSQNQVEDGKPPLTMKDVLTAMIKAHEIQGVLALKNSFNRVGLDHVLLVKIATTAVVAKLLGGTKQEVLNAISHAFIDGQSLRTYRHTPNTMSRKSWAAGDASSRGVMLAMMCLRGEMGVGSALSVPTWGFQDVLFKGQELILDQDFDSYVMENILFKISFPAEFHAQTAVEAAIKLHEFCKGKIDKVKFIYVKTHESALRIISKDGPLNNPADRDHCLQYMIAIGLLNGELRADHYEDHYHEENSEIDRLREKMIVTENKDYSNDYLNKKKRSIANAIKIVFEDDSCSDWVEVEYPIGHRRRREEGIPKLMDKFKYNLNSHFSPEQAQTIYSFCENQTDLEKCPVHEFSSLWTPQ